MGRAGFGYVEARGGARVLALVALVALSGCDEGGTEPPPAGEEGGEIEVTVTADGSEQSGVTVRLFASGAATAMATGQTNASGTTTFTDVSAGSYEVEVEVPEGLELDEGQTARRSVSVTAGGSASVGFALVSAQDDPGASVVEIHLTAGAAFSPSEVTISPGTTVRWINDTSTFHTITPRDHSEWERVELDEADEVFEHTFEAAGTFDYFCEPHESAGMTGTITVE